MSVTVDKANQIMNSGYTLKRENIFLVFCFTHTPYWNLCV